MKESRERWLRTAARVMSGGDSHIHSTDAFISRAFDWLGLTDKRLANVLAMAVVEVGRKRGDLKPEQFA